MLTSMSMLPSFCGLMLVKYGTRGLSYTYSYTYIHIVRSCWRKWIRIYIHTYMHTYKHTYILSVCTHLLPIFVSLDKFNRRFNGSCAIRSVMVTLTSPPGPVKQRAYRWPLVWQGTHTYIHTILSPALSFAPSPGCARRSAAARGTASASVGCAGASTAAETLGPN